MLMTAVNGGEKDWTSPPLAESLPISCGCHTFSGNYFTRMRRRRRGESTVSVGERRKRERERERARDNERQRQTVEE